MEEVVLKASPRVITGKQVRSLRRKGELPAVLYGHNINPILVSLNLREASRVLPKVTSSSLVTIDVNGEQHRTLVRERQRHPVQGTLLHVDFQVVSMTEKLRADISLVLEGEAPAVKNYNGVLVTQQESLSVECLPGDLPDRITVDISKLEEIGNAIYVRDISLPAAIEVLTDPDEVVVVVIAPVVEVEEVAEEEAAAEEPEVVERGKKEEEDF
jgi:large subunit ribosomal protein L25